MKSHFRLTHVTGCITQVVSAWRVFNFCQEPCLDMGLCVPVDTQVAFPPDSNIVGQEQALTLATFVKLDQYTGYASVQVSLLLPLVCCRSQMMEVHPRSPSICTSLSTKQSAAHALIQSVFALINEQKTIEALQLEPTLGD